MSVRIAAMFATLLFIGCSKEPIAIIDAGTSRVALPESARGGPQVEPHPHETAPTRENTLRAGINAALDAGGGSVGVVNEADFWLDDGGEGEATGKKF